ncbi:sensor histidine kinase [Tenacibaculum maritimum]|uniref:sensor histidine kinase n=1 Tax=Tenacibaculum maritimum TaxID=107401 RepID=UPI00388E173B
MNLISSFFKVFKKILIISLSLLIGAFYFSYRLIPPFSQEYYEAESNFIEAKKNNTKALSKLKEISKNSEEYKNYKKAYKLKKERFKTFIKIKEEEKVYFFRSLHHFWERFAKNTVSLIFSIWVLIIVMNSRKQLPELVFWSRILIISTFISVHFFTYFWIFSKFKDLSDFEYWLMIIFMTLITNLSLFLIIKYRKTTIQRLKKNNKEAYGTIKHLQEKVLIKQEKEREEERQRISEELHDGILGKLFGTRMKLGLVNISNEQNKEIYQSFLKELQEIEVEIREVSHKLSANLDGSNISFTGIIEQLLKDKSILNKFDYLFNIDQNINWSTVNEANKLNIYRIIQEAIQNIIKHARASEVLITFTYINNNIKLEIKDNGIGLDYSKIEKGIGFKNIKLRVLRLKGKLTINSSPNKGTSLTIRFPHN